MVEFILTTTICVRRWESRAPLYTLCYMTPDSSDISEHRKMRIVARYTIQISEVGSVVSVACGQTRSLPLPAVGSQGHYRNKSNMESNPDTPMCYIFIALLSTMESCDITDRRHDITMLIF